MQSIEKMLGDGSFDSITKKERLTLSRDKEKMESQNAALHLRGEERHPYHRPE